MDDKVGTRERGRVAIGDAKVESTTSSAHPPCATSATAAMSVRRSVGLQGVSTHTSLVSGRIAAATAAGSLASTAVAVIPNRGSVACISSATPGYCVSVQTT